MVDNAPSLYKTSTISRLTGYSPLVLRAWERRHGLLCPHRAPSGHRLYTEDDLRVLRHARKLMDQGYRIGEVAAVGRDGLLHMSNTPNTPIQERSPSTSDPLSSPPRAETDGCPPLSAREAARLRAQLVRSAMVLDERGVLLALRQGFDHFGHVTMLADVVRPALCEVGRMWESGRLSVAAENVLSQSLRYCILGRLDDLQDGCDKDRSLVICVCVEEERHDLGVLTLALALSSQRRPVLLLSPNIPLLDVDAACHLRAPGAVCLSFKQPHVLLAQTPGLEHLAQSHPGVRFFVGGDAVSTRKPFDGPNVEWCTDCDAADGAARICNLAW